MANVSSYGIILIFWYEQKGTGYEIDAQGHSYENQTLAG